jgi:hypothetical protein
LDGVWDLPGHEVDSGRTGHGARGSVHWLERCKGSQYLELINDRAEPP